MWEKIEEQLLPSHILQYYSFSVKKDILGCRKYLFDLLYFIISCGPKRAKKSPQKIEYEGCTFCIIIFCSLE